MSVTVRKNFVLNEDVAKHLEELAKENNQSMTSLVEEMVEERYGSIKVQKRMKALDNIKAFASGPGRGLLVGKSIQSIKADMDV